MFTTYLTNNSEAYAADGGEIVYALGGDDQIYVIPVDDSWGTILDWDYTYETEVHGGSGDDLLVGHNRGIQFDILYGDSGNDTIRAGGGPDRSYGGTGDDTIWTGDGEDYVDAGADDDTVYATEATNGDVFHGGSGFDVLHLFHSVNESWNFSLLGGGSTYGLVATGFEELHFSGGDGVETVEGGNNRDWIWGGGGGDILGGQGGDDYIFGDDGNDLIDGDDGDDGLYGDAGGDTLRGGAGDDYLQGGTGNDFLWGGDHGDSLAGGADHDSLRGEAGNDVLHGDAGNDTLRDGSGADTVYGDGGDDTIYTGTGNDVVWGGSGNDSITEEAADQPAYYLGFPLHFGDELHGGSGDDYIHAGAGHDTVYGDADDDILVGGEGDDLLIGGLGGDWLAGGSGTDTADYSTSGSGVTVNLAAGSSSGGDAAGDSHISIENLTGSGFTDNLYGDSGANRLRGLTGHDDLIGNGGADRFVFETLDDSSNAAPDQIHDFSTAQGDRIDLSLIDADTGTAGNQAFTYIGTGDFTGVAGQLNFQNGLIQGDVTGDGGADFRIEVNGTTFAAGDFIL
jgi:Ca2+-binding RTX toxin-like protein